MNPANEWALLRERVDRDAFERGRLGPYRLGEPVRLTDEGQVVLAVHDTDPRVAELEILDPVRLAQVQHAILEDVNQSIGLDHRHLVQVLGGGIAEGLVYVARVHRLGRTLAEAVATSDDDEYASAGIAYSAVEAVHYLLEQGPARGACNLGGFDARDVLLSYDGSVLLLPLGLRGLRDTDRAAAADVDASRALIRTLEDWTGRPLADVDDEPETSELLRRLRRAHGDHIADRRNRVGALLREAFPDRIRSERAFFGLATLH